MAIETIGEIQRGDYEVNGIGISRLIPINGRYPSKEELLRIAQQQQKKAEAIVRGRPADARGG